jgi:hypothetical protein
LNEADFVGAIASTSRGHSRLVEAATSAVQFDRKTARWRSLCPYYKDVPQAIEPAGGLPSAARYAARSQNVAEDAGIANRTGTETRAIVAKLA